MNLEDATRIRMKKVRKRGRLTAIWVLADVPRLGIDDRLDQRLQVLVLWQELV
jgi:hypothetical protein